MFKCTPSRAFYTASQALGTAASTANDFFASGVPTNCSLALISAIIDGLKAYTFQGKVIADAEQAASRNGYTAINVDDDDVPAVDNPGGWSQWFAAIGLNGFSAAFTVANRYFLVTSLCTLLGISIVTSTVWSIVLSDCLIKILFDLTNELYETNEALASYINAKVKTKPIYANWRWVQSTLDLPGARFVLAIIGTLEHSIVDDILPWIVFIPPNVLAALAHAYQNFLVASAAARALAIMTPLIGGLVSSIIIFQTILFEAEHSYEAYRSIDQKAQFIKSLFDRMAPHIKGCLRILLRHALWLMPACHGAATAAPVFTWMKKLFSLDDKGLFASATMADILMSLGTMVTTIFAFLGTARGHQLSELRESQKLLSVVVTY